MEGGVNLQLKKLEYIDEKLVCNEFFTHAKVNEGDELRFNYGPDARPDTCRCKGCENRWNPNRK